MRRVNCACTYILWMILHKRYDRAAAVIADLTVYAQTADDLAVADELQSILEASHGF